MTGGGGKPENLTKDWRKKLFFLSLYDHEQVLN